MAETHGKKQIVQCRFVALDLVARCRIPPFAMIEFAFANFAGHPFFQTQSPFRMEKMGRDLREIAVDTGSGKNDSTCCIPAIRADLSPSTSQSRRDPGAKKTISLRGKFPESKNLGFHRETPDFIDLHPKITRICQILRNLFADSDDLSSLYRSIYYGY